LAAGLSVDPLEDEPESPEDEEESEDEEEEEEPASLADDLSAGTVDVAFFRLSVR
jgi:hypothetical protein